MARNVTGLLAGQGDLPVHITRHCLAHGIPFFIVALEGQTDPALVERHPHVWLHLGEAGKILSHLKEQEVTRVIMAGAIRRPSWSELKLDWKGTQWLARMGIKALGDDGLLKNAVSLLESEGFKVISPAEFLNGLLAPEGVMTRLQPDEQDWQDITRGRQVLDALSAADVGQAVVIQQGLVLGIEAVEGTDGLIRRCGLLRREGRGGTLVKIAKLGQTHKVDLPTIGVGTVRQAQAAGLRGIAVSAGSTQVLDRQATIREADKAGIYLVGIPLS